MADMSNAFHETHGRVRRQYHRWHSERLGRDMELLVFGHAGARVIFFPTRCGRFFDYENFGVTDVLARKIERGWLQLYCVEGIDQETFYCDWCRREDRIRRHLSYERYILDEVVPLSDMLNHGSFLMTAGCSLGAYHAVNMALRHPDYFRKAVGMSGRFDLTQASDSFRDLLDGYFDDDVYYSMPSMYLPNVNDPHELERLRQTEIVLAVGEADPFFGSNFHLAATLGQKGVRHALHSWSGRAHSMRHWRRMVDVYL